MRALLWTVAVLAFAAGVQLFVFSDHTDRYFAWTIQPSIGAALLGATYWSASAMAFLSVRSGRWSRAQPMVVGILAVTPLLLVVTLVHLAKFHLGSLYGIAWLVVYASLPVLTPLVIARQIRRAGSPPDAAPIPRALRRLIGGLAVGLAAVGLVLLFAPSTSARFWPWALTPLLSRALGSWLVAYAITAGWVAARDDLARCEAPAVAYAVFAGLGLIALVRYAGSVRWASARTIVLVAALALAVVGGSAVAVRARRARPG
jgi:hypothetical protein